MHKVPGGWKLGMYEARPESGAGAERGWEGEEQGWEGKSFKPGMQREHGRIPNAL